MAFPPLLFKKCDSKLYFTVDFVFFRDEWMSRHINSKKEISLIQVKNGENSDTTFCDILQLNFTPTFSAKTNTDTNIQNDIYVDSALITLQNCTIRNISGIEKDIHNSDSSDNYNICGYPATYDQFLIIGENVNITGSINNFYCVLRKKICDSQQILNICPHIKKNTNIHVCDAIYFNTDKDKENGKKSYSMTNRKINRIIDNDIYVPHVVQEFKNVIIRGNVIAIPTITNIRLQTHSGDIIDDDFLTYPEKLSIKVANGPYFHQYLIIDKHTKIYGKIEGFHEIILIDSQ